MEDMHIHLKKGISNEKIFNEYIKKCISLNLKRVVFLDHGNRISSKHVPVLNSKESIDMFNNIINKYNEGENNNKIQIIRGIEIDYSTNLDFREETKKILDYGKFEWIVGGIHSMKFATLADYLKAIIDMLNNYNISVVAHLKLDNSYKKHEYLLIKILKLCFSKNVFLEINTSERSRWNDQQLLYMLNLMNKYNVKYVFSSDAHDINEIAYMIPETIKKVKKWEKIR